MTAVPAAGSTSDDPIVVVGIPTYRRPDLLRRLLTSLEPELSGKNVTVVVGDNDAGDEAPAVVRDSTLGATCVPVATPGIAAVRNELVRSATRLRPDWTHLVMLDDDGFVGTGWFTALVHAIREHRADVTAGPVLGQLPDEASRLARNSIYAGRVRHPSGPVAMLNGAQNIAISRRIVDVLGDPWFPDHLGRIGGEDHYFFRHVVDAGGTLAWCEEAPVTEPTPADRLTAKALLRRAYRSNRVKVRTDLEFTGTREVATRLAVDSFWIARKSVAAVVRRDPDRAASTLIDVAALSGRAAGLIRPMRSTRSHAGL